MKGGLLQSTHGGSAAWQKEAMRVIRPSLEELLVQGDSRYTLVVMAARRARKIMSAQKDMIEAGPEKPVTRALREIAEGKVSYHRPISRPNRDP